MLRRRLFVLGIYALVAGVAVAGVAVARAEPVNRKFVVARRAKIDCAVDPGGTIGSPCRRAASSGDAEAIELAATHQQVTTEKHESTNDADASEEKDEPSGNIIDDLTAIADEARGHKKKRGYLKIFFAMAAAAKAALLYAMIHAVALVAGKALVVAKVALALAAAVALKKALGEHHEKTSYEIVKHPHHSYVQTHSASVDYDHHGGTGSGGYEGGHRRRRRFAR